MQIERFKFGCSAPTRSKQIGRLGSSKSKRMVFFDS
jgi:hypothetical protein